MQSTTLEFTSALRTFIMQIKDLTTDELKALIHEMVRETIEELLPDPDAGLTIKPEFEQSLLAIR